MSHLFATLAPLHPRALLQSLNPLAHDCGHLPDAVTSAGVRSRSSSGEIFCGDAPLLAPNAWVHDAFVDPPRRPKRLGCDPRRRP